MLPAVLALAITSLPPTSKPGGIEKLIDALAEIDGHRDLHDDSDPRLDAIIRLGFDAVPALIEHLSDTQVTNCRLPPMDNFRGYTYRVGDFARDILNGYLDDQGGWFERLRGDELKKEDAQKWWAEAKKLGEEKYLLQNLTKWRDDGRGIRAQPLRVLVVRYPEKLPDAFAAALKAGKGELHYSPLVQTVVESQLPAADKKRLVLDLYGGVSWYGKAAALAGLQALKDEEFAKRYSATLDKLPADEPEKDGIPGMRYIDFARVACLTADTDVWAAVQKYLQGASAAIKFAWIDTFWLADEKEHKASRTRRIECLLGLLTDKSVKKRSGNSPPELRDEVRNHAAWVLAWALDLDKTPDDHGTADDWKKFREELAKLSKDAIKKGG